MPEEKGKRKRAAPAAKKETKKAKTSKVSFLSQRVKLTSDRVEGCP